MIHLLSLFSIFLMCSASAGTLKIEVSGVKNSKGSVRCLLFSSADGYPDVVEKAAGRAKLPASIAKDGKLSLTVEGVDEGKYAVVVIHDENNNGMAEKNFLGIPKEPIAVSNWSRISKPKFHKNCVMLTSANPLKLTLK